MKKTTVLLTDPQSKELKAISKRGGLTVPELIRRAVDAYISSYTPATHLAEAISRASDPLPCIRFGKYVRFAWLSPELEQWLSRRRSNGKSARQFPLTS